MNVDFSRPCGACTEGAHDRCAKGVCGCCAKGVCGCLAGHVDDDDMMRGFKRLKRLIHPEREAWVKGGWRAPIRVEAQFGTTNGDTDG